MISGQLLMFGRLLHFLCGPLVIQRIGKKGFINRHEQLDQSASFSSSELLGVELQDAFPVWHGKRSSAAAQGAVQTPRTQCKHGANALTARSNSTKVQHENVQSTPQSMTSKYFHSL